MQLTKDELESKLIDLVKDFTTQSDISEMVSKALEEMETPIQLTKDFLKENPEIKDSHINNNLLDILDKCMLLKFPLRDKINAVYDNLFVGYTFNKNEVLNNKFNVVNIGLFIPNSDLTSFTVIPIIDNTGSPRVDANYLDTKFCDFKNLDLEDLEDITNNDLRQIISSKLDIDSKGLEIKADLTIKGDNYKILEKSVHDKTLLFIRYICPSTGRIYYNELSLNNLSSNKFYEKSNYESYIKAWWSISTLGANPDDSKLTIVRC